MTVSSNSRPHYLRWGIAALLAVALHAAGVAAGGLSWWRVPAGGDVLADVIDVSLPTQSAAQPFTAPAGPRSEEMPEAIPDSGSGAPTPEKAIDAPIAEQAELPAAEPAATIAPAAQVNKPDKTIVEKQTPKRGRDKAEQRPQRRTAPPRGAENAQASVRATAGERPSAAAQSDYGARVMAHLQRFQIYPREARLADSRGMARLRVAITARGQVVSAQISQSSGSSVIDQAALATIQRASPLPAPPPGASRSLNVPMNFALR